MHLIATAVCPHPPLLIPELAGAAAGELDELRAACAEAVARLLSAGAQAVLVLGAGPESATYGPADHGSLRPYGLDRRIGLTPGARWSGAPRLPLSLLIGAWLLREVDPGIPRWGRAVAPDTASGDCRRVGAGLLDRAPAGVGHPDRVALLVMADGTACRGPQAPGYHDDRAGPYDDRVAAALATPDIGALLDLDGGLSDQLRVAGRAPWQVLAGAVRATGRSWRAELLHHTAPYGVGYFVASWTPVVGELAGAEPMAGPPVIHPAEPGAGPVSARTGPESR